MTNKPFVLHITDYLHKQPPISLQNSLKSTVSQHSTTNNYVSLRYCTKTPVSTQHTTKHQSFQFPSKKATGQPNFTSYLSHPYIILYAGSINPNYDDLRIHSNHQTIAIPLKDNLQSTVPKQLRKLAITNPQPSPPPPNHPHQTPPLDASHLLPTIHTPNTPRPPHPDEICNISLTRTPRATNVSYVFNPSPYCPLRSIASPTSAHLCHYVDFRRLLRTTFFASSINLYIHLPKPAKSPKLNSSPYQQCRPKLYTNYIISYLT
jgi:hypothetical protein